MVRFAFRGNILVRKGRIAQRDLRVEKGTVGQEMTAVKASGMESSVRYYEGQFRASVRIIWGGLLKHRLQVPLPKRLNKGGNQVFSFLTSFQLLLLLVIWRPYSETSPLQDLATRRIYEERERERKVYEDLQIPVMVVWVDRDQKRRSLLGTKWDGFCLGV